METRRSFSRFHYSDLKPTVIYARQHWLIPEVHEPWQGFEDKTTDPKLQLKAVRKQILDTAGFFMRRGETPTSVVIMLDDMFFGQGPVRRRGRDR